MSESLGLGKIITTPQSRDAIHIAVAPVTADENLSPGAWVGFTDKAEGRVGTFAEPIGIVDPFLKNIVIKGQKFWMYLQPGSIVSLRHEWLHPAFDSGVEVPKSPKGFLMATPEELAEAQAGVQEWADKAGLSYDEMIAAANDYLETGEYLCEGARWEGFWLKDEFWDYFEVVTGKKVPHSKVGSFFSCSC